VSRKVSELSKTINAPDSVAERAQALAASVEDPKLAKLLLKRAHAIRLYPKMRTFQQRSTLGKVLAFFDSDMREYVLEGIMHRLSLRTWRKPNAKKALR
jgi:hypothetical protein